MVDDVGSVVYGGGVLRGWGGGGGELCGVLGVLEGVGEDLGLEDGV